MIRVTSGSAKGRKLTTPHNTQKVTAVKEVVKLAIFSIIGDQIIDAKCLDLYAGSGNLGIEALSRGAKHCDFVDDCKQAEEAIIKNLRATGFTGQSDVRRIDTLKFLDGTGTTYDLIFADPYYSQSNLKHLIKLGVEKLNNGGYFFILSATQVEFPTLDRQVYIQTRKYGRALFTLLVPHPA